MNPGSSVWAGDVLSSSASTGGVCVMLTCRGCALALNAVVLR